MSNQNLAIWRQNINQFVTNQTLRVKKEINNVDSLKVLDIGYGGISNYIKNKLFPQVVVLDFRVPKEHPGLVTIKMDICEERTEQKWDFIYCLEVLEHTNQPWIAAENLSCMLVDNGYLLVSVPSLGIHPHGATGVYPDLWRFLPHYPQYLFPRLKVIENKTWKNGDSYLGVTTLLKKIS